MSDFYFIAMRRASHVLFWCAIMIFVVSIWSLPVAIISDFQTMGHDFYAQPQAFPGLNLRILLINAVSSPTLPFFGAAILWRIDRYVTPKIKEAAE